MKTFTEKESLLQNVNARISKKHAYYKLGEELEKYLSDAGLEYGIDCTVADYECINKNFFLDQGLHWRPWNPRLV